MKHQASPEPWSAWRVAGLPLGDVDAGTAAELRRLLADHGVLVMPGQQVDDAGFVAFLRQFGDLTFTAGETPVSGFPTST